MSYSNLLKGRFSEPNRTYFVTTVTNNRLPIFENMYCARDLALCINNHHLSHTIHSLAWVIMPDHFHWLFQLGSEHSLANIINQIKGASSRNINCRLKRTGKLWQKSYYDRAIRDNEDIKEIARYIIANPLRAGLVEHIGDYPHWDACWL